MNQNVHCLKHSHIWIWRFFLSPYLHLWRFSHFPPNHRLEKIGKKDSDERTGPLLFCTQLPEFSCRGPERKRERERRNIDSGRSTFPSSSPFHMRRGRARRKNNLENKIPNSPRGTQRLWTSGTRNTVHTHTVPEKKRRKSESSLFFLWLPRKMQFSLSFICSRGPPFPFLLLLLLLFFTLLFHRAFGKKEGVGERKCMHREQAALARNSGTRNPRSEFRQPLFDKYVQGKSSKHLKR